MLIASVHTKPRTQNYFCAFSRFSCSLVRGHERVVSQHVKIQFTAEKLIQVTRIENLTIEGK